jgi:hypothetical protein
VERAKPFIGQITVIEGIVYEHEGDYNYGEKYVQEFNDFLDTLPFMDETVVTMSERGCEIKITIEVIGPED